MLDWSRSRYADNESISKADLDALAKSYLGASRASRVIVVPHKVKAPDSADKSKPIVAPSDAQAK